jgi:hypothetical protein
MRTELLNRWNTFLVDAKGIPIELSSGKFLEPSSPVDVEALEAAISHRLPPKFREFLLHECGGVDVWWHFKDDAQVKLGGERECIGHGSLEFRTNLIMQENPQFRHDFRPSSYDIEYRPDGALAFASTPNGDQYAVMLTGVQADKIVYLSHDLEKIHRYVVGDNFSDFLLNFARLGFVGPEFWVVEQFTNGQTTPIDADSPKAREFLACLQRGIRSAEAEAESRRSEEIARKVRFKHIIEPELHKLVEAKSPRRFLNLVDGYVDLLSGALKIRYEYFRKQNGG